MRLLIVSLITLLSCTSGHRVMTMDSFFEVPVGTEEKEVVSTSGKPYAIHKKKDGSFEYEYIERIKAGSRDLEVRHYFFVIKDGRVISKRVEQSSPAPYTFDSYEMQTTQNQ